MPRILMPIGDATEALDTFYAYYRLPEDGFDVVAAGPEARLYHTVLHEIPPNPDVPWDITQERPGDHLQATVAFGDLVSDASSSDRSGGVVQFRTHSLGRGRLINNGAGRLLWWTYRQNGPRDQLGLLVRHGGHLAGSAKR